MALATASGATQAQEARPPEWSQDVLDAFFPDAREKLEGERPDYERKATTPVAEAASPGETGSFAWSKLIEAETIETEIKRLSASVAEAVASAGEFKGGGFKKCRRHFSELAVLFAVISEFDGQVRWQDVAGGLRGVFARAGYNAKVGSDQTFREATERKQDLEALIRGERPQASKAEAADWGHVADRPPLMRRLNQAQLLRLKPWLADEREFEQHRDDVRHEAQLVAMLAEVIGREGFEFWDDAEYAQYARELRHAATDVATAAEDNNYEQARQAAVRMSKACADCHEGYRG